MRERICPQGYAIFHHAATYWRILACNEDPTAESVVGATGSANLHPPVGAALITIILKFTAYLLTDSVGLLSDALESVVNLSGFAALAEFYPAGLVDRYSRTAVVTPGGLGMVGALALFAASGSYPLFLVAAVLLGLASGLAGPAPAASLADALPVEDRTTGVGVYRAIGDVSAARAVAPGLVRRPGRLQHRIVRGRRAPVCVRRHVRVAGIR